MMNSGLSSDLKRLENRLSTFEHWPVQFIQPLELANAGFYYLNNSDEVKCVECGVIIGKWEPGDQPFEEHKKFFPNCRIVKNEEIGIQSVRPPKHPEFSTIDQRTRSFSNWTSTAQDATVLAQAGFYFLGIADEVRCFYCDGGLRNWLQNDNPWFEHTRWFPKCPFIKLVKGSSYIRSVIEQTQNNSGQSQATTQASAPTPPMSIEDAMNSQPVQEALQMGLNAGRVKLVMQRRLHLTGRPFTSTEALVSAVLDGQMVDEEFENNETSTSGQIDGQVTELLLSAVNSVMFNTDEDLQPSTSSTQRIETTSRNFVPENSNHDRRLMGRNEDSLNSTSTDLLEKSNDETRLRNVECKICMTEEVGVVFLPCGHLLSCVFCAPALSQCPLCREPVLNRVRTFLS